MFEIYSFESGFVFSTLFCWEKWKKNKHKNVVVCNKSSDDVSTCCISSSIMAILITVCFSILIQGPLCSSGLKHRSSSVIMTKNITRASQSECILSAGEIGSVNGCSMLCSQVCYSQTYSKFNFNLDLYSMTLKIYRLLDLAKYLL